LIKNISAHHIFLFYVFYLDVFGDFLDPIF